MKTMTMYLVEVSGQGDHWLTLVTKDVFDWICDTATPGRKVGRSSWYDTATPSKIRKGEQAPCSSGSFQNDRALFAIHGDFFTSTVDLVKWIQENDVIVEDGFDGCIY